MMSTRSPAPARAIPIAMPIGEAHENRKTIHLTVLKSVGKDLTSEIPRELEAAPLCTQIAMIMLIIVLRFFYKPRASPSKIA